MNQLADPGAAPPPLSILTPDAHLSDLEVERGVSGERFHYVRFDELDPAAIPDEIWRSCDAVLVWHRMKLGADVIAKLDRCRLIVRVGVGFDNVDCAACTARGIPVSNVPNYGTTEVADHALAMLLYLTRGLGVFEKRMRADPVAGFRVDDAPIVRRIRGSTFGAVGMGRIGTAIARRATAFDMKVIYVDPYAPEGHELGLGFERLRSLDELLDRADVVSLHTPLNQETRNIIGAPELARMKSDAILINVARGGLVDVDALYHALKEDRIAAAGLDVLPVEPPSPAPALLEAWRADEPWLAGRFIYSPHAAYHSAAGLHDMRKFSAEIAMEFLFGGRLRNNVNPGWDAANPR